MAATKTRPHSKYTPEVAAEICERLSNGETLRAICRSDAKFPVWQKIYEWMAKDAALAGAIAHARLMGHDAIAEDVRQIAQSEPLAVFDEAGNKRYDPGSIAHKKLMIETDLKLLAKWNPKKWGDRTTIAGDDESPLVIEANFDVFGELLKNLSLKRQAGEQ